MAEEEEVVENPKKGLDSVEIPKHMEKFVDLLDLLKKLTEENLEETLSAIRHSYFQEDYDEVAANLVFTTKQPIYDEHLAGKLTYKLCIAWKLFNLSVLHVFASMDNILPFTRYIRSLFNYGIWTFEEVSNSLKDIPGYQIIFAKEISINCPQDDDFDALVKDYRENNWYLYSDIMKNGFPSQSIGLAIKKDDVDSLQSLAMRSDFDFNQKIRQEYFSLEEKSLITTAAFYGSLKCFKYLLENEAKMDLTTSEAAIQGGNREIIDLCQEKGCDCTNFLQAAVISHRDDLFEWIIESTNCTEASLYDCVRTVNYRALLYYVQNQKMSESEISPLCMAAQMGIQSMCRVLVENGDPMTATVGAGYTALHLAIKYQHFYVVTYLVTNGIEVNQLTDDKLSPYDLAVEANNEEIVSYIDYNNAKPSRQLVKKK